MIAGSPGFLSLFRMHRGDLSALWPEGCVSAWDVSAEMMGVFSHAERIVSWLENLTEDETPPEWMWPFDWETEPWLEVKLAERKRKFGGDKQDNDFDFNDESEFMQGELPDWAQ